MMVLSRRLREAQGMDRSYLFSFFLLPIVSFLLPIVISCFFLLPIVIWGGGGGGGQGPPSKALNTNGKPNCRSHIMIS